MTAEYSLSTYDLERIASVVIERLAETAGAKKEDGISQVLLSTWCSEGRERELNQFSPNRDRLDRQNVGEPLSNASKRSRVLSELVSILHRLRIVDEIFQVQRNAYTPMGEYDHWNDPRMSERTEEEMKAYATIMEEIVERVHSIRSNPISYFNP